MQKLGFEKKWRVRNVAIIVAILLISSILVAISWQSIPKIDKNCNCCNVFGVENGANKPFLPSSAMRDTKVDFVSNAQNEYVKIGGKPIGIAIDAYGLIVVDTSLVDTLYGKVNPLSGCNVQKGDVLKSVNGQAVQSIYQFKKLLDESDGEVEIAFERNGVQFSCKLTPAIDLVGSKKLGLILKEDVGGVGTLTFVTRNNRFAALGHYIFDNDSNLGAQLQSGEIYNTKIDDVIKGERGQAGGLVADVNRLDKPIGKIDANTNIGIYGDFDEQYDSKLYKIAGKGEAKLGRAQVYTTIEGDTPKFYDIDVVKVVPQDSVAEKGMVILVKDRQLLEKTGGIVQGMSGSPIVQDGVLIGAVTHVFVQDPARGYAVHSRFMYEMAQQTAKTTNLTEQNDNLTLAA